MANFNKVFLMGNLTRDPQLSYTPNQTAVADFGFFYVPPEVMDSVFSRLLFRGGEGIPVELVYASDVHILYRISYPSDIRDTC